MNVNNLAATNPADLSASADLSAWLLRIGLTKIETDLRKSRGIHSLNDLEKLDNKQIASISLALNLSIAQIVKFTASLYRLKCSKTTMNQIAERIRNIESNLHKLNVNGTIDKQFQNEVLNQINLINNTLQNTKDKAVKRISQLLDHNKQERLKLIRYSALTQQMRLAPPKTDNNNAYINDISVNIIKVDFVESKRRINVYWDVQQNKMSNNLQNVKHIDLEWVKLTSDPDQLNDWNTQRIEEAKCRTDYITVEQPGTYAIRVKLCFVNHNVYILSDIHEIEIDKIDHVNNEDCWDLSTKHTKIQLSNKMSVVKLIQSGAWFGVFGSKNITDGQHRWRIKCHSDIKGSYIGIIPANRVTKDLWSSAQYLGGYSLYSNGNCWHANKRYGRIDYKWKTGDIIDVSLDMSKLKLCFHIYENGVCHDSNEQMIGFESIQKMKYRFAVSMGYAGDELQLVS